MFEQIEGVFIGCLRQCLCQRAVVEMFRDGASGLRVIDERG